MAIRVRCRHFFGRHSSFILKNVVCKHRILEIAMFSTTNGQASKRRREKENEEKKKKRVNMKYDDYDRLSGFWKDKQIVFC